MPPRTSAAQGAVFPFSSRLIALRGPVAGASCSSCAAVPFSATRGCEKPATSGSELVLNRHRRAYRTGLRDVPSESYEIGMSYDSVRNIDSEVVGRIACAPLRHEDEIPGAIIGGWRLR